MGALVAYTLTSAVAFVVARHAHGRPGFWVYMPVLALALTCHNALFPNLNAAAMVPVGHVAGTAAAVIGTVSTIVGALAGSAIDRAFDGTVNPFSTACLVAGGLSLLAVLMVARRGRPRPRGFFSRSAPSDVGDRQENPAHVSVQAPSTRRAASASATGRSSAVVTLMLRTSPGTAATANRP